MWHTNQIEEIYKKLKSSKQGLTNKEAEKRLKQFGYNVLPKGKKNGIIKIFITQFLSPIIAILILAIVLSLIIGEKVDALFIFAVIMINGVLGTVQEYAAEKSAEKLQDMIKVCVKVIRNGKQVVISAKDLVPMNPSSRIST